MAGIYAPDGSLNVTITNGSGNVAANAPDGSLNVTTSTPVLLLGATTTYDLRLNFGAPGTGTSQAADTAAFLKFLAIANASSTPTKLMIPNGTFTLTAQEYLFTKSITIEGYTKYGSILQIASGSDISGVSMIHMNGSSSFVTRNMTYDTNHAIATTGKGSWMLINPGNDVVIDNIRMINGGAVSALPAQMQLITAIGFNSFIATNSQFSFDATQNTSNGALNLGSIQFAGKNVAVSGCTATNCQLLQHVGVNYVTAANNVCTGAGYGAGIGNTSYWVDQTAGASWALNATTITMATTVPSYILNGMTIYDNTSATVIGTIQSFTGSTLTLVAGALAASSGSADSLRLSIITDYEVTYTGNIIVDTGTALDVNGTHVQGIQNWQAGAVITGNKIRNTCGPCIINTARAIITGNLLEDPGSGGGGAFNQSAIASQQAVINAGVSSGAAGSTYSSNTARNVNTTNGLYGLTTSGAGIVSVGVNDFSAMPSGAYNFAGSATFLQPTVLDRTTLPFVLTSSGTMGNNGALSGITALATTHPAGWYWMEAGQIAAGSLAGWYYGVGSSATAVTLFNNTYTTGTPKIPTSPTAFVTTGPGAFTRTVATHFNAFNSIIPANMMGLNGTIEVKGTASYNNSAGVKTLIGSLGASSAFVFGNILPTTTVQASFFGGLSNSGATNVQVPLSNSGLTIAAVASAMTFGAKDTTVAQTLNMILQVAVASDTISLESCVLTFYPGQ